MTKFLILAVLAVAGILAYKYYSARKKDAPLSETGDKPDTVATEQANKKPKKEKTVKKSSGSKKKAKEQ